MSEDKTRDIFVTGLKNAHAMENQALSIMKPQVKRIENYPDIAEVPALSFYRQPSGTIGS